MSYGILDFLCFRNLKSKLSPLEYNLVLKHLDIG